MESEDKEPRAISFFYFYKKFMHLSGLKYLFLPFQNITYK